MQVEWSSIANGQITLNSRDTWIHFFFFCLNFLDDPRWKYQIQKIFEFSFPLISISGERGRFHSINDPIEKTTLSFISEIWTFNNHFLLWIIFFQKFDSLPTISHLREEWTTITMGQFPLLSHCSYQRYRCSKLLMIFSFHWRLPKSLKIWISLLRIFDFEKNSGFFGMREKQLSLIFSPIKEKKFHEFGPRGKTRKFHFL